jgi:hypothetical protein
MQEMERVGRSRHRRCDPGRAHRLLHPRFVESASLREVVAPDYPINRLGDEKVEILSLLSWIAATQTFSMLRTQNIRNAFPGAPIP